MRLINVDVQSKIAVPQGGAVYVCGNSDYVIRFNFDEEWSEYDKKTARFEYGGKHQDVVFAGSDCPVPVISNTYNFHVGVYAGNLHTTTPAYIPCKKSILCGGGVPADPVPDVYAQIMEMLNNAGGMEKFSPADSGKLLYIGADGAVLPLSLGAGLEIADGVLSITNAQAVRAICGTVLAGQVKCGEV